jgi:serine/threonine-protein kinase
VLNTDTLRSGRGFEDTAAAFPDTTQFQDAARAGRAADDGFADTVPPEAAPDVPARPAVRLPFAGRFELIQQLGQGRTGTVWAARDHLWMRLVALKLLGLQAGDAVALAEARSRFRREAEIAQRLLHPDIVETYEAGADGAQAWLAMELVAGVPLARYAPASRLLPEPVVLEVVHRVALAVAHAHRAGVIHRDLKPANVIVDWPTRTVKLADFGIAHLLEASNTATGLLLGSPAYMAPELLAGARPSVASDLYALGLMLFELLTGERPHDEESLGELMRRRHHEPAPDVREVRPTLPRELAELLASALAQRPAARPADAESFAQRLASVRRDWHD